MAQRETPKVLIYGGYGSIGLATARILRDQGVAVHLVGRDPEKLSGAAAEVEASFTAGDVTDHGLFDRAVQDAGDGLTGLVYAVGTINLRGLQRFTGDDFLNDFNINAVGAALAVRAALPAFRKSGETASVVLYSSVAAGQGFSFHSSIGMAKGAVSGLAVSLAAELAPKVRVNAVAPSLTRTNLTEKMLSNEKTAAAIAGGHPMQRLGTAQDIAAMTAFLLSPDSGWITGQVIGVDGGRSTLNTGG